MKLCKSGYQDNWSYLVSAIKHNHKHSDHYVIAIAMAIFWVLFITIGILCYNHFKQRVFKFDDKLALGLAAAVFSGLVIYILKDRFLRTNFCLLNKNELICIKEKTDCFDQIGPNNVIDGASFGFINLIQINSSRKNQNKGIGKKHNYFFIYHVPA